MPTKAIRVLSFADNGEGDNEAAEESSNGSGSHSYMRQDIYRLIAMLAGDPEDEESDDTA